MTTIRHETQAACPPARVWALLSDLEAVQHYNPGVRSAAVEGAQRSGVGARRSCDLLPKGRVVERVTHWEDGRAVGLEVADSDWPIHFMRWITRIEPSGGGTRITQALEYKVKFGPIGWLLDRLMMKRKWRSATWMRRPVGQCLWAQRSFARKVADRLAISPSSETPAAPRSPFGRSSAVGS